MSDSCSGSCGSCSESCSSRQPAKEELLVPANAFSKIKRVIGVVSGKGGVGKSFVTSYLAANMQKKGYETAILDADITGPSIPKAFGIHGKACANEIGLLPSMSKNGTKVMSVNLLVESEDTPVVWRGSIISGVVKQFWSEVVWGDVDYMFVDMPPGTGDVPLTVYQSIPLDGIIIVTSPQELVSMIVSKAVNMANAMDIPILGIVENYSYVSCSSCSEKIKVFGESHVEEVAEKYGLKVLAQLPLDPVIANHIDQEKVEELEGSWLDGAIDFIETMCPAQEDGIGKGQKKLAVAADENNNIFQHFGTCGNFTVYQLEDGKVVGQEVLAVDGSGHSVVANALVSAGVHVLICGGIGEAAMKQLMNQGITVIPGQQGDVTVAASAFLDGSLFASNTPTCNHSHEEGEGCSCGCDCHH